MSSPTPRVSNMMRAATETTTMITTGLCSLEASATAEKPHIQRQTKDTVSIHEGTSHYHCFKSTGAWQEDWFWKFFLIYFDKALMGTHFFCRLKLRLCPKIFPFHPSGWGDAVIFDGETQSFSATKWNTSTVKWKVKTAVQVCALMHTIK